MPTMFQLCVFTEIVVRALQNELIPCELNRVWDINDGEPTGPYWELTFITALGLDA
jgi:hypothetical protein